MKVEWRYYNDKGVVRGGGGDLGQRSGTLIDLDTCVYTL